MSKTLRYVDEFLFSPSAGWTGSSTGRDDAKDQPLTPEQQGLEFGLKGNYNGGDDGTYVAKLANGGSARKKLAHGGGEFSKLRSSEGDWTDQLINRGRLNERNGMIDPKMPRRPPAPEPRSADVEAGALYQGRDRSDDDPRGLARGGLAKRRPAMRKPMALPQAPGPSPADGMSPMAQAMSMPGAGRATAAQPPVQNDDGMAKGGRMRKAGGGPVGTMRDDPSRGPKDAAQDTGVTVRRGEIRTRSDGTEETIWDGPTDRQQLKRITPEEFNRGDDEKGTAHGYAFGAAKGGRVRFAKGGRACYDGGGGVDASDAPQRRMAPPTTAYADESDRRGAPSLFYAGEAERGRMGDRTGPAPKVVRKQGPPRPLPIPPAYEPPPRRGTVSVDVRPRAPMEKTSAPLRLPSGNSMASGDPSLPTDYAKGGHLSAAKRQAMPKSDFALPGQGSGPKGVGSGAYPINDASHARNALSRVAQHGSPTQQAEVRAKVHRKFPGIGEK